MTYEVGFVPGFVLFSVFGLLGCALITLVRHHWIDWRFQAGVFLIAITLRYAFAVVIYQFGLVDILKDEDASGWTGGVALYNIWAEEGAGLFTVLYDMRHMWTGEHSGPEFLRSVHRGYYFLLGLFFYLTDSPARLPAAALNCFCGALTVVFSYRIARSLFSDWVARRVAWWLCVFPSMIVWSAMTIKEPVVILLEVLALYGCVRLNSSRFTPSVIILCSTCAVFLIPFRFYACSVVGATTALSVVLPKLLGGSNKVLTAIVTAYVLPFILAVIGLLMLRQLATFEFGIERVASFRSAVSTGGDKFGAGSGVDVGFEMSTPTGFGLGTLVGATHLLLAPFPWQLSGASLRMALTLPELLFWWYLYFTAVVPGTFFVVRHRLRDTWPIALFLCAFGLLYSVLFGNVGLVFRQRAQLLPFLLLFGAVGLERHRQKRSARRLVDAPRAGILGTEGALKTVGQTRVRKG